MPRVLVVYYSRSGNTEAMARAIAAAIEGEGLDVDLRRVEETKTDDLVAADGIVMGSPTYYGTMAAELKALFDESVKVHSKLDGKAGGAFSTAAVSGNETAIIHIIEAMLVHGMVVQGDPSGNHYGVTSLGEPGNEELEQCRRFGTRFAALVKSLQP